MFLTGLVIGLVIGGFITQNNKDKSFTVLELLKAKIVSIFNKFKKP